MTRLVFEPPPARTSYPPSRKTKHQRIATALKKRPGEWARIGTYAKQGTMSSVAFQIRNGTTKAYGRKGTYEAVGRTVDGKHTVWARYLGENGEYA